MDEAPPPDDAARLSAILAAGLGVVFTVAALALVDTRTALSIAVGASVAVANLVVLRMILAAMLSGAEAADAAAAEQATATAPNGTADGSPEGDTPPADDAAAAKARGRRGGAAWGVFAVLKIFLLFGGIWLLLARGWVSAIPLVIGYGVLPLGITGSTVVASMRPRRTGLRRRR